MVLLRCVSSAASTSSFTSRVVRGVSDAVAMLGGGGAERDEQVGLAGAGVPDQAQRVAAVDPVAGGELADGQAIDSRVVADIGVQLHS